MLRRHFVIWTLVVAMIGTGVTIASGQDYPSKPVRLVATGVGGGLDYAARLIAPALGESLGQQVIVDNRSQALVGELVAKAPPDGYTLLINGSNLWLLPLLRDDVRYDVQRDFAPITLAITSPNVLVVHPSLPVKSVKELIALAKARPKQLNYSTSGTANANHISAELFRHMARVDITKVAYRSSGMALTDLIAGEVQLMFLNVAVVAPHLKSGKLRALAVTTSEPSPLAPGLPTMAAAGVPGYEAASTVGILAPAKTPAAIIARLNHEIVKVLNVADVKEQFFKRGVQTVGSSSAQFAAYIKSDIVKWGKVFKNADVATD